MRPWAHDGGSTLHTGSGAGNTKRGIALDGWGVPVEEGRDGAVGSGSRSAVKGCNGFGASNWSAFQRRLAAM